MSNYIRSVTLLHETFPPKDVYPFSLPLLHQTKKVEFDGPLTFFVGENGTGKSTLLEALARASGVHIWSGAEGARFQSNAYEKLLHRHLAVDWAGERVPGAFFGSETFNDFRKTLDSWASADAGQLKYFGGESLVTKSHGQSMMAYFRSRYCIEGIYFLDEPETALSPGSQLELLEILGENAAAGHAQFIIATHSPILLACDGATIYSFDDDQVREIPYKETDHYRIYRDFLLNR